MPTTATVWCERELDDDDAYRAAISGVPFDPQGRWVKETRLSAGEIGDLWTACVRKRDPFASKLLAGKLR